MWWREPARPRCCDSSKADASFPSGHATDSAALVFTVALIASVIVLRRPLARVVTMASAGLAVTAIGMSRLELGVHYPTDVLAGWALGTVAALTVTTVALLIAQRGTAEPTGGDRGVRWMWDRVERLLVTTRFLARRASLTPPFRDRCRLHTMPI